MMNDEHTKIVDGAATSVEMLEDGVLQSIVVFGVYADGSGAKIWSTGNETVNDILREKLLSILPLPPRRLVEDDDGA